MATNLTIESPNFDKIAVEAGDFTSAAISLLWSALNDTRTSQRRGLRRASEILAPKVLSLNPTTSVDDLDLQGASILEFVGSTAVNFTGMRAPDTDFSRIVVVCTTGSATITAKHQATSESSNQLYNTSGGDVSLATGAGIVYVYLSSRWHEVA